MTTETRGAGEDRDTSSAPTDAAPTPLDNNSSGSARSSMRWAGLDGIRALAVVLVVVHHAYQPARVQGHGVDISLVLSGFLITSLLLREHTRRGRIDFFGFAGRRLLRLWPALLLMVAATFAFVPLLSPSLWIHAKRALFSITSTGNLYMTFVGDWLGPFSHTWSLALQEQFYVIWPLLLILLLGASRSRGRIAFLVLLGGLISASLRVYSSVKGLPGGHFSPVTTSFGLLWGCGLALVLSLDQEPRRVSQLFGSVWTAIAGLGLLTLEIVGYAIELPMPEGVYAPIAAVAAGLLVGHVVVGSSSVVSKVMGSRPSVWLGQISYGIYLWHFPLLLLMAEAVPIESPLVRLVVVLAASVLIAKLSYTRFEVPIQRRGNQYLKRRPPRRSHRSTHSGEFSA